MPRATWNTIKGSKTFYVRFYRKLGTWLIGSLIFNIVMAGVIVYAYLHHPERDYYATSGITAPIKLTGLSTPNYSDQALLPPDPVNDDETRLIPQ